MTLYLISFIAWALTILAPCVLPVLPVILWGTLNQSNYRRILLICWSFVVSIIFFTLILKVSTAFLNIDESVWTSLSWIILILLWLITIFPTVRDRLKPSWSMWVAQTQNSIWWNIILGISLWPVFSSCSPTYALILATILPLSLYQWIVSIIFYALGLWSIVFAVAVFWRRLISKMHRALDSDWWFKKIVWLILLITGILIFTWYMKKLEVFVSQNQLFDITKLDQKLLPYVIDPKNQPAIVSSGLLNADYPAPDLTWIVWWINTSGYQSLSQLSWKVVIIDFWTYSCINCIRTLPYLQSWYTKYADEWLVIIWVSAPEFQFEKKIENVRKAALEAWLTYPIWLDNNFATRRAYNNLYRPAKYIIDRNWRVRYTHFGEWKYDETEKVIRQLLGVSGSVSSIPVTGMTLYNPGRTAETYLWSARSTTMPWGPAYRTSSLPVTGSAWMTIWDRSQNAESIILNSNTWSILLQFRGNEVNLVMSPWSSSTTNIMIDGVATTWFVVDAEKLYNLYTWNDMLMHTVRLDITWSGTQAYAFTFK